MKTLPTQLVEEKNKLQSTAPWLILLDIDLVNPNSGATETIKLVRNTEDIIYPVSNPSVEGDTYYAFPFEMEPVKRTSKGAIPTLNILISNTEKFLQSYMEEYEGGLASSITITIVNADNLDLITTELEVTLDVLKAEISEKFITFTMGAPSPLIQRFPLERYLALHCRWRFKSCECGYAGALTTCDRTLEQCRTRDNAERFGGFPGLSSDAVRVV